MFELGKTFGRQAMYRFVLVYFLFPYTTLWLSRTVAQCRVRSSELDSAVVVVRTATYTPFGPEQGKTVGITGTGSGVLIGKKGQV